MFISGFSGRAGTLLGAATLAAVALASPADATVSAKVGGRLPMSAACTAPSGQVCIDPSRGNSIQLRVNFSAPLGEDAIVCFDFTLAADLVDPDEELSFVVGDSTYGYGFAPPGDVSQSQRTVCVSEAVPGLADLRDGHALVTVFAFRGSFRLTNLEVRAVSS